MNYWHDHELRLPLREVASRYPKTYQKVGAELRKKGLTSEGKSWEESRQILYAQWIATLAAMPPHVVPYQNFGDSKTWAEQDWISEMKHLDPQHPLRRAS
jgi:hypothetical protein